MAHLNATNNNSQKIQVLETQVAENATQIARLEADLEAVRARPAGQGVLHCCYVPADRRASVVSGSPATRRAGRPARPSEP